jgi:hypothetical protein
VQWGGVPAWNLTSPRPVFARMGDLPLRSLSEQHNQVQLEGFGQGGSSFFMKESPVLSCSNVVECTGVVHQSDFFGGIGICNLQKVE